MLLSDDRLTRRAIDGDQSAFTAIFERYQEPLYRYCLAILGDREDAEDALQSAMLKVLRALPGEERRIELKPWLYRIAHNESVELIRRRRPREELDTELVAGGAGPAEEAGQRQRLRQLLGDLDQLPERQRGTLVMRELGGLGFEEIGAALGTSAAVARQTLYEARLGLREMDAGREMDCDEVTRAISDADGRVLRRRDLRAHLRTCDSCHRFSEEISGRERDLAALSPLPAAVAAGLLQAILGGGAGAGAGAGGAGAAGAALGAGAAKTIGASTLLKGAVTFAVVAALGVGAADEGGLIHVGLPGEGGSRPKSSTPPASEGAGGGAGSPAPATDGAGAIPMPEAKPGGGAHAKVGAAAVAGGTAAGGEDKATAPAASPGESAAEAPSPERQPSSGPSHGRETAAAHKATPKGAAKSKPAHPSHPAKPVHPAKPTHPEHPSHPEKPVQAAQPEHPAKPETAAAPEPKSEKPEPPGQGKP
ncbi:MAG TPA: sigma-70 family RNA polymerase sigma factor [Solirubrobacterales bacterium]|nr:sigma-70 family RNA polymerase sigma factor [Solirubrobacterales bacterium]